MSDQNINLNRGDEIDFGKIFRVILMQSKLIMLLVFLGTAIGFIYYQYAERIYKFSSLLHVYSEQSSNFGTNQEIEFFLGSRNTDSVSNIANLYKSRSNILNIAQEKRLNIKVNKNIGDKKTYIKTLNLESNKTAHLTLEFKENNYTLKTKNDDTPRSYLYNNTYEVNDLIFEFAKPTELKEIELTVYPLSTHYKRVQDDFNVVPTNNTRSFYPQNNKLIKVEYLTNDLDEGTKVLNYANKHFIEKNIFEEAEQARLALSFIEENIKTIKDELDEKKNQLKTFKERNKTINVDLEVQKLIDSIAMLDKQISDLDIELSDATSNYTQSNPIFIELLNRRSELDRQRSLFEQRVANLPLAQQEYIDLFREVENSQEVYAELINRRLEYSIKEASTLGNIRVVDEAYYDTRVSPSITIVILSFLFSAIISLFLAIYRGLYVIPISNPAEFADNDINQPIFGVLPNYTKDTSEEKLNQAIESLIVNINTSLNEKDKQNQTSKTIAITSGTPENGKSYCSRNLALKLSDIGKKTLLIDADWKRGDQHKEFKVNKITLKEFSTIDIDDPKYKVKNNLYFIPKITGLKSSFQFLYSKEFTSKISDLKDKFDYIIFDTPPLLSVSDTAIIMTKSDLVLCVARHGLTRINEVRQMVNLGAQIGATFDGIIYNGYEKPSSYYGYYGLYGNYSYQYYARKYLYDSYDYDKNK